MGNTNNYDIEYIEPFYNDTWIYKAKIKHIYLDDTFYTIETLKKIILEEKLREYIFEHDKEFADKYNSDLEKIRNNVYKSKLETIDWERLKEEKSLYWERKSEYIIYSIIGNPTGYLRVNSKRVHSWKPRLLPFQKKDKVFLENKRRYFEYQRKEENWKVDYANEVNRIKISYNTYDSDTIERYCNLIFMNIKFHKRVRESFPKNNLILAYNKKKKILNINLTLPLKIDIEYLLKDMLFVENQNKYMPMYMNNEETNIRLESIWGQIILVYIHALFKYDKINAIDSIYFNGVLLNDIKYQYELIIDKDKLYKKDSKERNFKSIDNFINTFRRDSVILRKLRSEEIVPFIENNNKNIISLTIREQRLNKKVIEYITSFKYLEELYLIDNELMNIPKSILKLSELEVLSIENNQLVEIPFFIEDLNKLHTLKLDNNLIESLDKKLLKSFLNMPNLKKLLLNNNPIQNLINKDISLLQKDEFISELLIVSTEKNQKKKISNKNTPLIITEGKTDWKHLKKALERFQSDEFNLYLDIDIEFDEFENISMSDSELDNFVQTYAKQVNLRKIICIFDRDLPKRVEEYGQCDFVHVINKQLINTIKDKCRKEYSENSKKYLEIEKKLNSFQYDVIDTELRDILTGREYREWDTQVKNNVYAFCIPKLSDELDEICIEFYYKEKDLKKEDSEGKRLFTADEFEFTDKVNNCNRFISKCGKFKTDTQSGNNHNRQVTLQYPNKNERGYVYRIEEEEYIKAKNINLSKNDFVKNIENEVKGFESFDIENFRLIFDIIEKIVNE